MIPQIESAIEERLLQQFIKTIPNEMERDEVQKAYLMRRHLLTHVKEEDSEVSVIG